jgi:hypothetical protein
MGKRKIFVKSQEYLYPPLEFWNLSFLFYAIPLVMPFENPLFSSFFSGFLNKKKVLKIPGCRTMFKAI